MKGTHKQNANGDGLENMCGAHPYLGKASSARLVNGDYQAQTFISFRHLSLCVCSSQSVIVGFLRGGVTGEP